MKLLVISHNVFCQTSNMGKTLSAYFNVWNKDDIAQLYIHSEMPSENICANYYRITDKDIIKSIITRKSGTVFNASNSCSAGTKEQSESKVITKLYQKGKSRTPIVYFLRNFLWRIGVWKTDKLLRWIDEFSPDAIFLAVCSEHFPNSLISAKTSKVSGKVTLLNCSKICI